MLITCERTLSHNGRQAIRCATDRQTGAWFLICMLLLVGLSACGRAYRFRYSYEMVAPQPAGQGIEDDRVRIRLTPYSSEGVLRLAVLNKSTQRLVILWEETHYINPLGRRQDASETGTNWFFRPSEWFATGTPIAPGSTFRAKVQPGQPQTYNPFTVSRQASGEVSLSSTPRNLFPSGGTNPKVGKDYEGREFRFILALRIGKEVVRYPFTFRITAVHIQQQRQS